MTPPVPDEGAEGGGAQPHVALDAQEAQEERGDAVHQAQVLELLGVLGVDLLQAQRGQAVPRLLLRGLVRGARLHRDDGALRGHTAGPCRRGGAEGPAGGQPGREREKKQAALFERKWEDNGG